MYRELDAGGDLYARFGATIAAIGVTPQRALFALAAIVLGNRYGQSDITLGMALHRRDATNFHVVGMLAGMIAVRHRFAADASLRDSIRAVSAQIDADLRHSRLPIDALARAVGISANGLSDLFVVAVSYVPALRSAADLRVDDLHVVSGTISSSEASPLTLHATENAAGHGVAFTFAGQPDCLAAREVTRLMELFGTAIEAFVDDPNAALETLAPTTLAEHSEVVDAWNATDVTYPDGTLDAFFGEQARRRPDALAVVSATEALTYAELDARSDELAHRLIERGIATESVVGVALARSVSTVVAVLAILKAGAIYLPLDPAYPPERLALLLEDSRTALVVTDAGIAASLPAHIDQIRAAAASAPGYGPRPNAQRSHAAGDTAYIIYTSGSTGKPKGVAVPHAAAVNLAFARLAHDPIGPGDRILAAISVGFDVSIGQLVLPLVHGATVVIADDLRELTAHAFWDFIATTGVTHINSVPSFFDSILDAAPKTTSLHQLMLGGEPLAPALVRRLQQTLPATQVVNMYGPTEACIDATAYRATGTESGAVLPIGKPLPNYRAYILNARLDPVGVEIAGDLYLAGAGLAHGYLKAPALTAQRFIADPFGAPGQRLYATGDRARRRADGNIEFLGRADSQVKIRGHRIELGEIEARLALHAGVREAAVTLRSDGPGDGQLVAYYTAAKPLPPQALRAALQSVLPGYMVPATYVQLTTLPLTANGKLDRDALPAPDLDAPDLRSFEPPRGPIEEQIAAIIATVLDVGRVGRDDNFFERGGHSLRAMTVIERMRTAGLHADVRALFNAPTVAGLAGAASEAVIEMRIPRNPITPATTAITPDMLPLADLTQVEIDRIVESIPGGVGAIADIYPLAPLQEGILFRHLMAETGDTYLTPFLLAFDRRGRLELFLDALRALVARHDILRTAIRWENLREPVQVVVRKATLTVEDVRLNAASSRDAAQQLQERFDRRRFRIDVREAPLLRAYITHDATNDRWLLMLLSHHLVLDHASLEVILREVGLISTGRAAELSASIPFRNFVAQAQRGVSPVEHEAFFRELLADIAEPTTPFGALAVRHDGSGIHEANVAIDAALTRRIRARVGALGASPATFFHLAWALVLAHVSERDDVVFGTLLLGRTQSTEDSRLALGMFINTLPMRMKIDGTTVASAIHRTHTLLANLLRHEHASLALAQRCSGVAAPLPLFSALFNFRHSPAAGTDGATRMWPGVELVFAQERTDYPLALAVDDRTDDFLITTQADAPLDAARICAFMQTAVLNVLTALETAPQTRLDTVLVVPPAEHLCVTDLWNATGAAVRDTVLHRLIEERAARTPDVIAVMSPSESITYAELDARAEALANRLVHDGVGPQAVVGVALARSVSTVVAMLAILKAGAIYLPLDPAYPPERLSYMTADAGALLVVSEHAIAAPTAPVQHISIVSDEIAPARIAVATTATDTAYIIYTSGSTGKPKGVAVPHAAAVNLAFARLAHDPIGPGDRILAAISVGFDVSIGQLVLPLVHGATVVIADDLRELTAHAFWDFIATTGVTHINSVPSFFDSILDAAPKTTSLHQLMLGGEPLAPALVRRLQQTLPATQVVNMYGPTEACIDATAYRATGTESGAVLPIGKPLPNYRAYILNARLDPVGVEIAGDLYLAGAGLAHGYLNAPALTAQRFIADPFGAPGQRLYATGDRARRRADGNIEFLGRADSQVKIRGHRVELGEIEAALVTHTGIAQAAVIAHVDGPASTRLIAYVVMHRAPTFPQPAELRAHLAARLPDYMIPSAFWTLSALPLTANGKLDLRALPKPELDRPSEAPFEPPRTPSEIALQQIWQTVLSIDSIGRHDNFFALGGNSLAAIRLITICNTYFTAILPLRILFIAPTIAQLATAIDTKATATLNPVLAPLRTTGAFPPLFCIHPAGGHVFCYSALVRALGPEQPVYGLEAAALEAGQQLCPSIEAMAADYIRAIRSVQPQGPYQLLGMSSGGLVAYEMAHQLHAAGEQVSFLCLLDTSLPDSVENAFDEGELMRALPVEFALDDLFPNDETPVSVAQLLQRGWDAGRLPREIDVALGERVAAVYRNTMLTVQAYCPIPWSGSAVLFRALRRDRPGDVPPDWSAHLGPAARCIDMECTHLDIISPTYAPTIAAHIQPLLGGRNGTADR